MRRAKSLRIGVHHADAVVWEPVRLIRTRLMHEDRNLRVSRAARERVRSLHVLRLVRQVLEHDVVLDVLLQERDPRALRERARRGDVQQRPGRIARRVAIAIAIAARVASRRGEEPSTSSALRIDAAAEDAVEEEEAEEAPPRSGASRVATSEEPSTRSSETMPTCAAPSARVVVRVRARCGVPRAAATRTRARRGCGSPRASSQDASASAIIDATTGEEEEGGREGGSAARARFTEPSERSIITSCHHHPRELVRVHGRNYSDCLLVRIVSE